MKVNNEHISGETKMNTRFFLKKAVVVVVIFQLAFGQAVFAATTNKDLTLDDGTGDSPKLILQNQTGDNTLTLQKLDAGAGASTITGNTTFYNLTCVTASKQINFQAGSNESRLNEMKRRIIKRIC